MVSGYEGGRFRRRAERGEPFGWRRKRRRAGHALCAGLGALLLAAAAEAAGGEIVPHRAFYEVGLVRAGSSSGIGALSGAAAYEWTSGCERTVVNRETRLLIQPADGAPVAVRVDFSAWERLDGTAYGFSGKTSRTDVPVEERRGTASLATGKGGEVVYSRPEGRRLALAPGTLFPGAWVKEVIDHARTGNGLFTRTVFFGEDEDDLLTASLLVLPEGATGAGPETPAALGGLSRWRARIAFFGAEDLETPAFESTEWFYENGVGGDAVVAFPDFTVRYRLKELELLDPPDC